MALPYRDRVEAGQVLAERLRDYAGRADVVVLALPRGGVPVGYEVALRLGAPLDVMIVRKLGVPGHEELAMGAIATGGSRVLNEDVIGPLRIPQGVIDVVTERERLELARREQTYRGDRPPLDVAGRQVIVVDDGLATGATMRAAVEAIRQRGPAHVVVAVPVAPPETVSQFRQEGIDVICPATPEFFGGVGKWYGDFNQTTDAEVRALLGRAWQGPGGASHP